MQIQARDSRARSSSKHHMQKVSPLAAVINGSCRGDSVDTGVKMSNSNNNSSTQLKFLSKKELT